MLANTAEEGKEEAKLSSRFPESQAETRQNNARVPGAYAILHLVGTIFDPRWLYGLWLQA